MYHAHWNFDHGATGGAILSALSSSMAKKQWLKKSVDHHNEDEPAVEGDDALSRFQNHVFGTTTSVTHTLETVLERLDTYGDYDKDVESSTAFVARSKSAIEEMLRQLGGSWKAKNDDTDNKEVVWNSDAFGTVFDLVSILFCLERLHVQSMSYAPLKLGTDATPDQIQRLTGLNVNPVSSSTPCYGASAIALLKLPFWHSSSSQSIAHRHPPSLTLVSQDVGTDDDDTNTVSVTLTLGTLLVDHDDTHVTKTSLPMSIHQHTSPTTRHLPWNVDRMVLLEANIDDMTPEHLQFVAERVLQQPGAVDAWTTPIVMKKGRAAHTLSVLCKETCQHDVKLLLFRHSSTLGIRQQPMERASLRRRIVTVETEWNTRDNAPNHGRVDVKVAYLLPTHHDTDTRQTEEVVSMKAEFDHCRSISLATGVPIQEIADQAVRLAKEKNKATVVHNSLYNT